MGPGIIRHRFIRWTAAVTLMLAAGALVIANNPDAAPELFVESRHKPVAPALSLNALDGHLRQLADYRGQLLILNFWAAWCGPCREEFPSMERARSALRPYGVEVLAVNLGDHPDAVRAFLKWNPVSFPVLLDRQKRTSENWQVRGLPTTYLITPDGRIFGGALGAREWDSEAMLDALRKTAGSTGARAAADEAVFE